MDDAAPAPEDDSTVEYAEDDDKTTPFDDDLRYLKTTNHRFGLMNANATKAETKHAMTDMGLAIDALRGRFGNPLMYAHQSDAERLLRSDQLAEGQRQLELLLDLIEASAARANAYVFKRDVYRHIVGVLNGVIELRGRRVDGRHVVKCAIYLVHQLISHLHVKRVPLLDDIWRRATAPSEVSGIRAMVTPEIFIDLQAEAAAALRQDAIAELEHYKSPSKRGQKRRIFEPMADLLARGDDAVFSTSALDMVIMTQRPLTQRDAPAPVLADPAADDDALPRRSPRKRRRLQAEAGS